MIDSRTTEPERESQPEFRFGTLAAALLLLAAIAGFDRWIEGVPNRIERGPSSADLTFVPVRLDARRFAPLRLAGAWRLTSSDRRFGGVSALAIDQGKLLALTDSGALIRFRPRSTSARIAELPGGPGNGGFKRNRDSEALVRDPATRGWWVAFENRHELWLYDPAFARPLERIALGRDRWRANKGIEALVAQGKSLLLIPEAGDGLLRLSGSSVRSIAIANAGGQVPDAASLADGRIIAVQRRMTPLGFQNALVLLERSNAGYRFGRRIVLPLGPLDNIEAIAVERLANGSQRLWLMSDDNFQPPLRTLLLALDLPAEQRTGGS